MSKKQYRKTTIPYLLNTAKCVFPVKWLEPERPKIKEWFERVEYIDKMDTKYMSQTECASILYLDKKDLYYSPKDFGQRTEKKWTLWAPHETHTYNLWIKYYIYFL